MSNCVLSSKLVCGHLLKERRGTTPRIRLMPGRVSCVSAAQRRRFRLFAEIQKESLAQRLPVLNETDDEDGTICLAGDLDGSKSKIEEFGGPDSLVVKTLRNYLQKRYPSNPTQFHASIFRDSPFLNDGIRGGAFGKPFANPRSSSSS